MLEMVGMVPVSKLFNWISPVWTSLNYFVSYHGNTASEKMSAIWPKWSQHKVQCKFDMITLLQGEHSAQGDEPSVSLYSARVSHQALCSHLIHRQPDDIPHLNSGTHTHT